MKNRLHTIFAASVLFATGAPSAWATEGDGTNATLGATAFQTPMLDGPGFYYEAYFNQYESTRANGPDGSSIAPHFQLNESVLYNQFSWVSPWQVGNFQFGVGAVVPLVAVGQRGGGTHDYVTGLADVLIQPIVIAWHKDDFYVGMAQGAYVPVGEYNANRPISLGRNTWEYQPQLSAGYINLNGLEVTATASYIISALNKNPMEFAANPLESPYQSGNEFEMDYAAGWNFTQHFELGVAGYIYKQTTRDKLTDPAADALLQEIVGHNFSAVDGIGPAFRWLTPYGEFMGQFDQEFDAKNHTQGSSGWLRWGIKF